MQAPRSLSDTTVLLEHEVLFDTSFGNDELVLLALPAHRDPSERRIHELVGVSPEFTSLPLLLEDQHVVGNRDLPGLVPLPNFLVEEVVLGSTDTCRCRERNCH